jgi:hypothetical protein
MSDALRANAIVAWDCARVGRAIQVKEQLMLVQEPSGSETRPSAPPRRRRSASILFLLTLAAVAVLVLRHDYWFWDTPYPLLFGFLPVGLWWQGLVSILAAGLMALMVCFAWPQELEDEALAAEHDRLAATIRRDEG